MNLAKGFEPQAVESRWYAHWEDNGYFSNAPDSSERAPYCIQLPPPNVTGTLHMGHAFQQTLMDTLIRFHRMRGFDVNWIVGTDHAGIATQIVVERNLEREGKTRRELGRKAFLDEVWKWKAVSGNTITRQMRRLGVSANWDYADIENKRAGYFTMDARMSKAVTEVFVRLFEEGLIYRGKRLVNWDPKLQSAVSDLEVDAEEEDGKIWEIRYPNARGDSGLVVATTRPETLLGDVAVAVNPNDERYAKAIGEAVLLPLSNRSIPVIADEYVDTAFGTGCVKITPAHDFNDYQIGQRHGLQSISIFTLDAKLNENVPERFRGLDRFVARARILAELKELGLLVSEKPYRLRVPRSSRTGEIVEPMLTDQWFVRMESFAQKGLTAAQDGRVRFFPDHWTTVYNQWLENIQDWCISRQLWWGHQIPAWYAEDGRCFVGRTEAQAAQNAANAGYTGPLTRDEDVLDTWFSSALVPFTTLGWPDTNRDMTRYLPSSVLVTGFDIIFFWVARMIMMTMHFTGEVPFRHVYINALVRDAEGQKMSKSKGNTIDPLDLVDGISLDGLIEKSTVGLLRNDHRARIEKYLRKNFSKGIPAFGADALRFTFASQATFARTLNFDLNRCEGYRNFCNKLWNASRFVLMNVEGQDCGLNATAPFAHSFADRWIISELQRTEIAVARAFADYRFDNAAGEIYRFVWDEYCDWYLEIAKIQLQSPDPARQLATRHTLIRVLEAALRLAHPIIPFITEELWQIVAPLAGRSGKSIMLAAYPEGDTARIDSQAEAMFTEFRSIVSACRNLRGEMGISPASNVPLIASGNTRTLEENRALILSLAKLSDINVASVLPDLDAPVAELGDLRLMLKVEIDPKTELERLEKEISRIEADVARATAKLGNQQFISRAPAEIVAQEKERLSSFARLLEKHNERRTQLLSRSIPAA